MTKRTRSILLSAVLATPLVVLSPAMGQYRINNGGANDANNRIGGNGSNEGGRSFEPNATNDYITGNVTGGREFRGRSVITDPRSFRGSSVGGTSDRFIRQSSSASENNAQRVTQFYGARDAVAPPAGFQQNFGSATYTPAPPPTRESSDIRLGQVYDAPMTQMARPGELMMPGQVDASNSQSLLTASPLYGIRKESMDEVNSDASFNSRYTNLRRNPLDRLGVDDKQLQDMRDELRNDVISDDPNDAAAKQPINPQDLSSGAAIGKPFESPETTDLANKPLGSPLTGGQLTAQVRADQTTRNQLVPPPAEQSQQYAELQRRFQKLQTGPATDQQANAEFNRQYTQRQADQRAARTGGGTAAPGRTGSGGMGGSNLVPAPFPSGGGPATQPSANDPAPKQTPDVPAANNTDVKSPESPKETPKTPDNGAPQVAIKPPTDKPSTDSGEGPALNMNSGTVKPGAPLQVRSLTDGMKAGRVRDMLATAEDQMRNQKYSSALDQYDLAERVVPNNPLITLGRAHAELGASYYARAENDIRRALGADSALLLAQFDLQQFLGRDRLTFLEKDLKDITQTEVKSTRAPFLLAYLKYHTGDAKMAANYLALSESRMANPDPLYKQLRTYWDLPKADPLPAPGAGDLNK